MIEDEERGWHTPDGHVCTECVEDEFLKDLIRQNISSRKCDFCNGVTRKYSAAPVECLMEPVAEALFFYFNEPTQAGVPYDESWVVQPTDTRDALMTLGLSCHDELFENFADSFVNDAWVPAADGHWASSHPHEVLSDSWGSFVRTIKHEVRFFFQGLSTSPAAGPQEYAPRHLLPSIGFLTKSLGLIRSISVGTEFFRVRLRDENASWKIEEKQLGAPPPNLARAGRMNPAGISYLYLALERQTALAEVLSVPPCSAVIAQFETIRALRLLDLSSLPEMPSIFDSNQRGKRERIIFLESFVEEISTPIRKDGREHIDYVPSQVVSEYFAMVFKPSRKKSLDGIIYPSAVRPGGRNVVLFPTARAIERLFDQVKFISASEISVPNRDRLARELA